MPRWLADTQAIALVVGRKPATIRSWAFRYPHMLPRRGTGKHSRALYDIREAEQLATWLAAVETSATMCNTESAAAACPEPGGTRSEVEQFGSSSGS